MSTDFDPLLKRRIGRGDFLKLGALAAGTGILAACGGEEEAAPPPPAEEAPAEAAPEPARPPIEEESGDLQVFEWAGYEIPAYGGLESYTAKYPKPKYTFLTSDDQALGKVRAGFRPDVVHPCVDYLQDWVNMGTVQPWDPALLPNLKNLIPELVEGGQVDGKQYFVPADWGFSSPLYRADKVEPEGGVDSWTLFYDERYKGKISWWDSPLENFVIFGYVNGLADPWHMTDAEIEEAKKFLISKKRLVRNFWSSQTDLDTDFAAGNVWIAYAWGGSFAAAKKAGLDVVYSEPKEGRLAWNCGLVLGAETDNYYHAHEYANAWISTESAAWIIPNYYYGHANTAVDLSKIDPEIVQVFHLDDPAARKEPRAHYAVPVTNRQAYAAAWDEVKAA